METIIKLMICICLTLTSCQSNTKTYDTEKSQKEKTTQQNRIDRKEKVLERTKALTEEEAIEMAEEFVAWQGYTSRKTDLTMEQALLEEGEFASDIKKLLESRHNLLQTKAWEARKFKGGTQWAVGFNYVNVEENIGRCIIMDTLGNNVYMKPNQLQMDWLLNDLSPEEKQKKMNELFE